MKIIVESTAKIVALVVDGHDIHTRVWQGETESGMPVQAFIALVTPDISIVITAETAIVKLRRYNDEAADNADPWPTVAAIPPRLIV